MAGYTCSKCNETFHDWTEGCSRCGWEEEKKEVLPELNYYQAKLNKFIPSEKEEKDMIEMNAFLRDVAGRKLDEIYKESFKYFADKGLDVKASGRAGALMAARTISLLYMYHFEVSLSPVIEALEEAETEDKYVQN